MIFVAFGKWSFSFLFSEVSQNPSSVFSDRFGHLFNLLELVAYELDVVSVKYADEHVALEDAVFRVQRDVAELELLESGKYACYTEEYAFSITAFNEYRGIEEGLSVGVPIDGDDLVAESHLVL